MGTTTEAPKTSVKTGKVRVSYPFVFTPRKAKDPTDGKEKYEVSLIIKKTDKVTLDAIKAAIMAAVKEGIVTKWNGKKPGNLQLALHDGDVEKPDDPAYANSMYVSAKSHTKPQVLDRDRNPIVNADEFYAGCYCRALLNFYPYNIKSNGVACGLNGLQKLAEGEPLSSRGNAEDEFDDGFADSDDDSGTSEEYDSLLG